MYHRILVTGGAGFIGSALIRYLISKNIEVINVDKLTYAGHLSSLKSISNLPKYHFYPIDICDGASIRYVLQKHQPDGVMHLAAESHVDKSINASEEFIQTNIIGTHVLLQECLSYWKKNQTNQHFRFHHVSTDEVFGSLGAYGYFEEDSPYQPNSPYSASKASSDLLVRAWGHTYGFPFIISNCSNNYGPFQTPEKLIPHMIIRAIKGMDLRLYGDGLQIRDWLFVDDHVEALWQIFYHGQLGQTYLVGGNQEKTNHEVVSTICQILDDKYPSRIGSYLEKIRFVSDRPGHDRRYAINARKLKEELNWQAKENFVSGIEKTITWYLTNQGWWQDILAQNCLLERQGVLSI